jgi:hypothetical protein
MVMSSQAWLEPAAFLSIIALQNGRFPLGSYQIFSGSIPERDLSRALPYVAMTQSESELVDHFVYKIGHQSKLQGLED